MGRGSGLPNPLVKFHGRFLLNTERIGAPKWITLCCQIITHSDWQIGNYMAHNHEKRSTSQRSQHNFTCAVRLLIFVLYSESVTWSSFSSFCFTSFWFCYVIIKQIIGIIHKVLYYFFFFFCRKHNYIFWRILVIKQFWCPMTSMWTKLCSVSILAWTNHTSFYIWKCFSLYQSL